ncbi:four helix bundle protein [Symmachiella dynata]|uniref:four helix bundle protein n=1 Tax=Symmachiella dynata TaxID=2527995 RepID=UPI0030EB26DC|tara:strand:+ start:247 stop:603 length:357 start_codon:yes stop_codon:yes gene_type:complete
MRDHTKLKAFHLADELTLEVYRATSRFPDDERFGLTSQIRRAAVSMTSNIVEGCARHSERDYLRFLDMAFGSAPEVDYQLSLAHRLNYITQLDYDSLKQSAQETSKVLGGLIRSLRPR